MKTLEADGQEWVFHQEGNLMVGIISMKTLEADGQEWVIHQEGKLMVGIITKAIKPAPLQLAVTKQLQLQRNKVLKSDVFRYVKWLRQFVIGYQLYGGMDDENLRSRW
ncbi:hypothetical protein DYB28_012056 [Aphanomyces astaci]|uniref:Uncharacterized protein n=1 Tax=Aphanomyces astaci TaxID=112090 RepID=A0A9X8H7V3_APHAT|nr:hypothetical protein DYB28_012056 [Aphanomyces astaci]